jgi:hypothetical protein
VTCAYNLSSHHLYFHYATVAAIDKLFLPTDPGNVSRNFQNWSYGFSLSNKHEQFCAVKKERDMSIRKIRISMEFFFSVMYRTDLSILTDMLISFVLYSLAF